MSQSRRVPVDGVCLFSIGVRVRREGGDRERWIEREGGRERGTERKTRFQAYFIFIKENSNFDKKIMIYIYSKVLYLVKIL